MAGARFNHELVFGVSVKNLSKAERLIYGDSLMTHAMILTAVTDKVPCPNKLGGGGGILNTVWERVNKGNERREKAMEREGLSQSG